MTDLDQRIATLREDHNDPSAWSREAMSIIDEQAAEIERLRARVRSLERDVEGAYEDERMDVIGQNGNDGLHYVEAEAGPMPLRGRITRRTT